MSSNYFVEITENKLNIQEALNYASANAHGAVASFIGTIRDKNLGRDVVAVSYDSSTPLATNVLSEICREVQEQTTGPLRIYISHFKGRLLVGEASIVIAVSSPHRNESFVACRLLLEEIKKRCPIWKKEHYSDGNSEWVKGHALCQH